MSELMLIIFLGRRETACPGEEARLDILALSEITLWAEDGVVRLDRGRSEPETLGFVRGSWAVSGMWT